MPDKAGQALSPERWMALATNVQDVRYALRGMEAGRDLIGGRNTS